VQANAGRLQDARRAVDTALRIDPNHRLSLLEDAELARRERDPLRAERSLRRLLQLEPDNPRFWANLAGLLLGLGRPAQARDAAASALGCDPQRPELLMLMADTEHAAGDHASTMARWRALSTTHPQLARVWSASAALPNVWATNALRPWRLPVRSTATPATRTRCVVWRGRAFPRKTVRAR